MNGIVKNLPDAEYHARPELSSTGARMLLPEYKGSPKKFQWAKTHPRNSRAFDVGHAVHAKVLGVGAGTVEYPEEHLTPSGNVSTKAATVAWETEQREAGLTPISPFEAASIDAMAEAVLKHESARPLLEVAVHREVSVFADVDGVPCRARFDALSDETRRGVIAVDLKSATDATPFGFMRDAHKHGYDVQEGWYRDVYTASEGHDITEFWFIVLEKTGPYEVGVRSLTDEWVRMGRAKAARARDIFRECTGRGVWPGYDSKPEYVAPPTYAVIDFEMEYESSEIQV